MPSSDIILVLWSEDSSKVKNEWITARALGKPINLVVITSSKVIVGLFIATLAYLLYRRIFNID
jgi:hypothetical protein